ncbi:EboA domain-containing protein [Terrimonas alba]|uniref:EboA domain-containing protein n=1 Tax=Terrimonas alba TaxID=3349636 RepID=UPI0035F27071
MDHHQPEKVKNILAAIIRENVSPDAWSWLEKSVSETPVRQKISAFVAVPRKTGHQLIHFTGQQEQELLSARPHFSINHWTIDRLSRVWLLLHLDPANKEAYINTIENLFLAAEMNELVALYSSLPLLHYPEDWKNRCAEGIRSNIGSVLEAIICSNPYPSEQLSDGAWNQLVMKAFFTEKAIHQIIGLDHRANPELASMLSDYASERRAAGRPVNPQLWRCVGPFIDEKKFPGVQRAFQSADKLEQEAAALACHDSNYVPAKELLDQYTDLKLKITSGQISWDKLADKFTLQPS